MVDTLAVFGGQGPDVFELDAAARCLVSAVEASFDRGEREACHADQCAVAALRPHTAATINVIVQVAQYRRLDESSVTALVGQSLGQFAAAVAAGSLPLAELAETLAARDRLARIAIDRDIDADGYGSLAIRGVDTLEVRDELIASRVTITVRNGPNEAIVTGPTDTVTRLERRFGTSRCRRLPIDVPYHTAVLTPAAEQFRSYLDAVSMSDPVVPVFSSRTHRHLTTAGSVAEELALLMCDQIDWGATLQAALAHSEAERFVDCSATSSMARLVRHLDPRPGQWVHIDDLTDAEAGL